MSGSGEPTWPAGDTPDGGPGDSPSPDLTRLPPPTAPTGSGVPPVLPDVLTAVTTRTTFEQTSQTTLRAGDGSATLAAVGRSSGLGSIALALRVAGVDGPVAHLRKRPLTTRSWNVDEPGGRTLASVRTPLLRRSWDVEGAADEPLGTVELGRGRPRGHLVWGGQQVVSFARASRLSSGFGGLSGVTRQWRLDVLVQPDELGRLVVLLLPALLDHHERRNDGDGGSE